MVTTLLFIALALSASWIAPKAFSWLVLGPILGIPIGLTVWSIAVQFVSVHNDLFSFKGATAFAVCGSLIVGFLFARGR